MEVIHAGELVRQYHPGPSFRITHLYDITYRIQRSRGNENRVMQCPSQYVSKYHCEISRKNQAFWIKDLGSTNGTFLNGFKIGVDVERELRFGDIIGLGVSHLEDHNAAVDPTAEEFYVFLFLQADPPHDMDGDSSGFVEGFTFTSED